MKIKILFAVQIFEMSSFFKKQNLGKKTKQNKLIEKKTESMTYSYKHFRVILFLLECKTMMKYSWCLCKNKQFLGIFNLFLFFVRRNSNLIGVLCPRGVLSFTLFMSVIKMPNSKLHWGCVQKGHTLLSFQYYQPCYIVFFELLDVCKSDIFSAQV